MHNIDIDFIEMTLDIMKYSINRVTDNSPVLGSPKKASELKELVGETITPNGISGEKAFKIWTDILSKPMFLLIIPEIYLSYLQLLPELLFCLIWLLLPPIFTVLIGC